MVQRHVHIVRTGVAMHLHPGDEIEEQGAGRLFVVILEDFFADAALLGSFGQKFLIVERDTELFREHPSDIASARTKLSADGDDTIRLHMKYLTFLRVKRHSLSTLSPFSIAQNARLSNGVFVFHVVYG